MKRARWNHSNSDSCVEATPFHLSLLKLTNTSILTQEQTEEQTAVLLFHFVETTQRDS